jgi:hypothetical protein
MPSVRLSVHVHLGKKTAAPVQQPVIIAKRIGAKACKAFRRGLADPIQKVIDSKDVPIEAPCRDRFIVETVYLTDFDFLPIEAAGKSSATSTGPTPACSCFHSNKLLRILRRYYNCYQITFSGKQSHPDGDETLNIHSILQIGRCMRF